MKKLLIIIAILAFSFFALVVFEGQDYTPMEAENSTDSYVIGKYDKTLTIIEDQSLKLDTYFKLGLTRNDVYTALKELNYNINLDEKFENGSIWCDNIHFTFGKDDKVIAVFVNDSIPYVTAKGLKMGDDLTKVLKLYGNRYIKYTEPYGTMYEYGFKENYFRIMIDDEKNTVTGFGISKDRSK